MMETRSYVADYKRFNELTGWSPKFSIIDGIERTVSDIRRALNERI